MTPYWRSEDGRIAVYCARWQDVLAAGLMPVSDVALIHDDPPYGQRESTNRGTRGRGRNARTSTLTSGRLSKASTNRQLSCANDFPPIAGDDQDYDPGPILTLDRPLVTWGAQRYADLLPPSPSWIWWGKREGQTSNDNGDGELAWTNLGGPPREFQHYWNGALRAALGLRLIWCEVVEDYCAKALARLRVIRPERAAAPMSVDPRRALPGQRGLFDREEPK